MNTITLKFGKEEAERFLSWIREYKEIRRKKLKEIIGKEQIVLSRLEQTIKYIEEEVK